MEGLNTLLVGLEVLMILPQFKWKLIRMHHHYL